jgi:hypothetical protein
MLHRLPRQPFCRLLSILFDCEGFQYTLEMCGYPRYLYRVVQMNHHF